MFNKKLLKVLVYILAVMLVLKTLLLVVTFILSYFVAPTDPVLPEVVVPYIMLLEQFGILIFFYLVVALLKKIVVCDHHEMMTEKAKKIFEAPVKTVRRVARKTRRRTKK
jgi:hypothetical protein